MNTFPDGRQSVTLKAGSSEERQHDRPPPAFPQGDGGISSYFCMPASWVVSREDASPGLVAGPQASGAPFLPTSSIGTTSTCHA